MVAGTENNRLNHQSLGLDELTAELREISFTCNINDFLVRDFTTDHVDAIARRILQYLKSVRQEVRLDFQESYWRSIS